MFRQRSAEEDGIERRGLLKGLGLGALGLAGTSAMADEAAAQSGMISFAALTPPGEDVEDDTVEVLTDDVRADSRADLVFSLKLGVERSVPVGYQVTIVDRQSGEIVPGVFEEGNSRSFSGTVKSGSTGYVEKRERFSVVGLGPEIPTVPPRDYLAVLVVADYSGLVGQQSACELDCTQVPFSVQHPENGSVIVPTEEDGVPHPPSDLGR